MIEVGNYRWPHSFCPLLCEDEENPMCKAWSRRVFAQHSGHWFQDWRINGPEVDGPNRKRETLLPSLESCVYKTEWTWFEPVETRCLNKASCCVEADTSARSVFVVSPVLSKWGCRTSDCSGVVVLSARSLHGQTVSLLSRLCLC